MGRNFVSDYGKSVGERKDLCEKRPSFGAKEGASRGFRSIKNGIRQKKGNHLS